ncbi:cuticular protein RR-2 motif 131 isoform X2 [Bombyx mori]|uniref:Cuticle protein n=1 Tax=Bombyx mori TaxID=7091 RepID=A0A8R2DJA3_BOMMO|nr:cuticular protein RR-2 motif 131 isoform X2 [Bombyx mori]
MIASMNKMWLCGLVAACLVAMATAQSNEYLPPNTGYNYDKPSIPFPTNNNGNQPAPGPYRPAQPTPSSYRPPQQRPTYVPPQQPNQEHEHHEHHDQQDHEHHEHHHHHEPGMPFDFNYAVNENGNDYSHNAISDGDVTKGEYRVALPDGRTQIVKYTADWKNGFNAEVSYEGEAQFPDQPKYGSGSGGQGYSEGGGYQY